MTLRLSLYKTNGTCAEHLTPTSGAVISQPVGDAPPPRCGNRYADVQTIQRALNRFSSIEGGPSPQLKPDGRCGPLTRAAIYQFQRKWGIPDMGGKPDGIVDVNGPTIKRLRQGPGVIPNLPVEFLARIPQVMGIVTTTRAALTLAKTGLQLGPKSLFGAAVKKVDRHFHITKLPDPMKRIEQLEQIFLNMQTAIGYVPQGVTLAADEPVDVAEGAYAFAFRGGYHLRGRDLDFKGYSVTSIYLCPKMRPLGADQFSYVMVHELAHYTGPVQEGTETGIGDLPHGYFHRDRQAYFTLTAEQAYHNADSYAQFAFEAAGKPDFLV